MKTSVWNDTTAIKVHDSLSHNIHTQVAIVGGGMCGILIAHSLNSRGIDCVVLDAGLIGCGVTGNTTAKVTAQHGLCYASMIRDIGHDNALLYLNAHTSAIDRYRKLCTHVDCDFLDMPSYVFSQKDDSKIIKEYKAVQSLGANVSYIENIPLPFDIATGVCFAYQAQFHPLAFLKHISQDMKIYENTKVLDIDGNNLITENGKVFASSIVITTHFPFLDRRGFYFMKMFQERSYVMAFKNAKNIEGMYIDDDTKGFSYRNYKDLLFVGGGDHRTGKKGGGYDMIKKKVKTIIPDAEPVYSWATQDCMTLDNRPYIGAYSPNMPNVYVATGFNKWGMTSSMVASELIADLILGKKNPCEDLFSPQRFNFNSKLLLNATEATIGMLGLSTRRCSHLGCALKYNKIEHTWDCPCHGSRFTEDGELIIGPANKGI